tara:strand:- start:560 stop:1117 length:558 start_codon:yes stop_codon:yes gene_type:complete
MRRKSHQQKMLHAEAKQQVTTSAALREQGERNKETANMTTTQEKTHGETLAAMLGIDIEEITESKWDTYGLRTFEANGGEYAIGTDEECDEAAAEYIRETVWAFQGWFIADHSPEGLTGEHIDRFRKDDCEDANAPLISLIEAGSGMADFIDAAISADGRGHFLAGYDGEELESDCGNVFAYRIN